MERLTQPITAHPYYFCFVAGVFGLGAIKKLTAKVDYLGVALGGGFTALITSYTWPKSHPEIGNS